MSVQAPSGGAWEVVTSLGREAGGPEAWPAYFARHARTFRMASSLFPPEDRRLVTGVYAFCRFTDDLVDDPGDRVSLADVRERLHAWAELAASAYAGARTGIPLLDDVLGEARRRDVSWRYPAALLEGVDMDLRPVRFPDWESLEKYTFCVAGAVGGWLTQLFGIFEEETLQEAHALGHGMQITNIARDVGEDWARGRLYVPEALLGKHGMEARDVGRLTDAPGPMPAWYVDVVEALIAKADAYYERAWPGIRKLPGSFRRPVAAAASAYRGIHREIRRNGHDNLRRRAHTSRARKVALAAVGLWRSRL
jgi:phytoene synthase